MAANCFAINGLLTSSSESELLAYITSTSNLFNSVNVATALRRLQNISAPLQGPGHGAAWFEAVRCVSVRGTAVMVHSSKELNGRTLSSALHSSAKIVAIMQGHATRGVAVDLAMTAFLAVLVDSAQARAMELDAQGLSNCLWSFATLRDSGMSDVALLVSAAIALCRAARPAASSMNAQELANTAWATAVLQIRDTDLMRALAKACCDRLSAPATANAGAAGHRGGGFAGGYSRFSGASFTAQGLAMVAWAFAKCKHVDNRLLSLLSKAFISLVSASRCDAQSIANAAWAFAVLDEQDDPLMAAIAAAAKAELKRFSPQGLTSLLWALSQHSLHVPAVKDLLPMLASAVSAHTPALSAQDLGLAAWALTHAPCGQSSEPSAGCNKCSLLQRAEEVAPSLTWKALSHVDLVHWTGQHSPTCCSGSEVTKAGKKRPRSDSTSSPSAYDVAMSDRMGVLMKDTAEAADVHNRAPLRCLYKLLKAESKSNSRSYLPYADSTDAKVAIFGQESDGKLEKLLRRKLGFNAALQWSRFQAAGGNERMQVSAWPNADSASVACVVLRYPGSGSEAFSMSLHAAAAALPCHGRLVVAGTADEGCTKAAVQAAGAAFFSSFVEHNACVDNVDCVVIGAVRSSVGTGGSGETPSASSSLRCTLGAWLKSTTLDLGLSGSHIWTTYPGLFAGGVLDVMTAALLTVLHDHLTSCADALRAKPRLLDFASGSGTIAKALSVHRPKAKLHLLDADALALAAASENVPTARLHLSDGWPLQRVKEDQGHEDDSSSVPRALQANSHAFDWIVSNPPVHSGQSDDFRVLYGLCEGAPSRLKEGGSLFIVAQEQVPVGRVMVTATGNGFKTIRAIMVPGGRFVVWHAQA